jgi:hypothetical protein
MTNRQPEKCDECIEECKKENRPIGSYNPETIIQCYDAQTACCDGYWYPARPVPYYSLKERIKMAYDVLTYKADAVYWKEKL